MCVRIYMYLEMCMCKKKNNNSFKLKTACSKSHALTFKMTQFIVFKKV